MTPPVCAQRGPRVTGVVLVLALGTACPAGSGDTPSLEVRRSAVINGADDRRDVWAHPNADLRDRTSSSTAALIRPAALRFAGPSGTDPVAVRAAPLFAWDTFCPGTPFLEQPTAATCGAVLVDDDLLLTAGHCLTETPSCRDFDYVFGYLESAPDTLAPVTRGDLYGCRSVAATVVSPPDSFEHLDFAFVQLDRPVTDARRPATVAVAHVLDADERLTVIGFPQGLPAKIDSGAAVADPRAPSGDFFTLTSDTFSGSSGSGVYDASGSLVGTFARGTTDTVDRGDCRALRTLADGERASGESATYASRAVAALCAAGWPSEKLCGRAPLCGDGICSQPTEDAATCSTDCPSAACGDKLCETSEWTTCPSDCGDGRPANLPDAWTCDAEWYGDGTICDCQCGGIDPDCGEPARPRACDSTGPAGIRRTLRQGGCSLVPTDREVCNDQIRAALMLIVTLAFSRRRVERGSDRSRSLADQ